MHVTISSYVLEVRGYMAINGTLIIDKCCYWVCAPGLSACASDSKHVACCWLIFMKLVDTVQIMN